MRIVMVASEVAPFSKEGGLADVLGALPVALSALGHDVCVISPLYRGVRRRADEIGLPLQPVRTGDFSVPIGEMDVPAAAWRSRLPKGSVEVLFLENDHYYDRDGYYTDAANHADYQDNSERFIFLSRGALELCMALELRPDVVHTHDWHTGLVSVYIKHVYPRYFADTATVFTIHNLAYQGIFWHWDMKLAGLPWHLFNWKMLEYYGNLSFLKAGLVGADILTTVSKGYSREIQTERYGCGMHGILQERSADLRGIVNGIEVETWNPATDPHLPANYDASDMSGKAECRRALCARFGLDGDAGAPVVGMISRLVEQKGLDLLERALPSLLDGRMQFAVLGMGKPHYHEFLNGVHERHPGLFGVHLEYDEALARLIEAGSDMFLMPSSFEPCGLNQLYSMRYGTVPVVRATGGLADTVTDCSEENLASGEATGFVFADYNADALTDALARALALYGNGDKWRRLMLNGMARDWSWKRSAHEYVEAYEAAVHKRRG